MLKFKIKNNANYNLTDVSYVSFNKDIIVDGEHYMQFVNNYKYNVNNYETLRIAYNDNTENVQAIMRSDFNPSEDGTYSILVPQLSPYELKMAMMYITNINGDIDDNGEYLEITFLGTISLLKGDTIIVESSLFLDGEINFSTTLTVEKIINTNVVLCSISDGNTDNVKTIYDNKQLIVFKKIDNRFDGEPKLFKLNGYINLPINFGLDYGNNLYQTELVSTNFFEVEAKKAINPIVTMEKDVYYPVYIDNNTLTYFNNNGIFQNFPSINEIEFNLHFRTRDLNNEWKVIDSGYWNGITGNNSFDNRVVTFTDRENQSDLLGYLNFTDDDVFYQKSKLAKSFIRLSFYDSPNPSNQLLLYYSTIFMNERNLFSTYVKYRGVDEESNDYSNFKFNFSQQSDISVDAEWVKSNTTDVQRSERRLSSRINVMDKYASENSSEGFYLYLFKENGEFLHERTLYLKIEFNHAGYGRTIPFMMPMEQNTNGLYTILKYGNKFPFNGYPINELYERMFIPIKLIYDYPNNRYVYYLPLDPKIEENKIENNKLIFNLFEIKVEE